MIRKEPDAQLYCPVSFPNISARSSSASLRIFSSAPCVLAHHHHHRYDCPYLCLLSRLQTKAFGVYVLQSHEPGEDVDCLWLLKVCDSAQVVSANVSGKHHVHLLSITV